MFQYPETNGPEPNMLDAGPVGDLAVAAERAGWNGFAFTEHPAPSARWLATGGHQCLDPFVALAHVGAVTTQLKLLTYLTVVPYRNPALLAKTAATLDLLSNGRLVLGVGAGYLKAEFHALGVEFDERNALFDEALDVLSLHWSGEPFDYDGVHFSCRGTVGRPMPVQRPIPIWIGGNSLRTLRRVAERAQGWLPLVGPKELFSTVRSARVSSNDELAARLRTLGDLAGHRSADVDIAIAYTSVSAADGPNEFRRHRDTIRNLSELGVTWVIVPGPPGPHPQAMNYLQRFAAEVITA